MAMKKVSPKANKPEVEEKAPESSKPVDGKSDFPSKPESTPEEPPVVVEVPVKVIPVSAKPVVGPDGKVPCKALKTCFVGGMVRYEGQTFRQFVVQAVVQAARGDLEILG